MATPSAVILAGGLGARLARVLSGIPKPLAPIAGQPFLKWIVRYLRGQGIESIVVSAGYLGSKVEAFASEQGLTCVTERAALGTAGGFLYALAATGVRATTVLACNGDSLVLTDLQLLMQALRDETVDAALLGVQVPDASRFGTLRVGTDGALLGFSEKHGGSGLVNGGVYLFRREIIDRFPEKRPLSFEYDVFPSLIASGVRIAAVPCDAPFLDIGTEASLAQADAFIRDNMEWFA